MPSDKRRRELARAKAERQEQRRVESARRARRNKLIGIGAAAAVAALFVAVAVWPDGADEPAAAPEPSTTAEPAAATPGPVATPAGVTCKPTGKPRVEDRKWNKPADMDVSGTVDWTLDTNCGPITIALDADAAPKTANGLTFLSDKGYYDGTQCHRLTTEGIFVLQCGSVDGTGADDPGFSLPDENLPKIKQDNYPAGTVAMANSGPGTAGSQFFIVYQDSTLGAPGNRPSYTIVGKVTEGLDIVEYVAAGGVEAGSLNAVDGPPAQPLQIESTRTQS